MDDIYIEKRKRGIFGWVFLIVFFGWNAFMLLMLFVMVNAANEMPTAGTEAGRAGAATGVALSIGGLLFVWLVGAVITGLFAMLTRGSKTIVKKSG